MNKIFFIFLNLTLFTSLLIAASPGAEILKAFEQKFPNAQHVKWNKESANNNEASFLWNGQRYAANFTDSGMWIETESPLTFESLPKAVQNSFIKNHEGLFPNLASKLDQASGTIKYEIEVKLKTKTIEFFYTSDGEATTE